MALCHSLGRVCGEHSGTSGKEPAANAGDTIDTGPIPGSGRSPGVGTATHTRLLTWKIPGTEEPGGLQSLELQSQMQLSTCNSKKGHNEGDLALDGGGTQAPVQGVQRLRRWTTGEVPLSGVISESLSAERDLGSPSATVVHEAQLQGLGPWAGSFWFQPVVEAEIQHRGLGP